MISPQSEHYACFGDFYLGYNIAMKILLHSSKTMKPTQPDGLKLSIPKHINSAQELAKYLKTLNIDQIKDSMKVSEKLAVEIKRIINDWTTVGTGAAMFSFRGDIYSGLQAENFNKQDIEYANKHLLILSGLYGVLRPLDAVSAYRLEMGYKLPDEKYNNIYKFWGDKLSSELKHDELVVNLTSVEYGKVILPSLNKSLIINPIFYTYNSKTKKNANVAVHSKVARGAMAHWLIKNRIEDAKKIKDFSNLGYKYDKNLSQPNSPVFVCKEFGGKGLSTRLK